MPVDGAKPPRVSLSNRNTKGMMNDMPSREEDESGEKWMWY
jgi:hypothetical protein